MVAPEERSKAISDLNKTIEDIMIVRGLLALFFVISFKITRLEHTSQYTLLKDFVPIGLMIF